MNYLLDEQLNDAVARGLSPIGEIRGDTFRHIYDFGAAGMDDADIPGLCADHDVDVLVSANVKDFGARKALYAALLDAGIHVVVLRPGKSKFDPERQLQMLSGVTQAVKARLDVATGPTLIRVAAGGSLAERDLGELIAEIEGDGEARLP